MGRMIVEIVRATFTWTPPLASLAAIALFTATATTYLDQVTLVQRTMV